MKTIFEMFSEQLAEIESLRSEVDKLRNENEILRTHYVSAGLTSNFY